MLQADRYWKDFCRTIGAGALADDPRFADQRLRMANAGDAIRGLAEAFEKKPLGEWLDLLKASGHDFIYTPVRSVQDLPDDPQARANGYVRDFEHPAFGTVQAIGMPFQLSATPGSVRKPAPQFGQHTEEVLIEVLGYSWDDIAGLKEKEVI
jgi:crotonobetainyl-CoA:carnitine CoA-transferase CaiB-like acyl-CoA transferase